VASIVLQDVHKRYRIYRQKNRSLKDVLLRRSLGSWEDRWALRGVSFEVPRGSSFGLVGANGAGKSTTLKLIARVLVPDRGRVLTSGRVGSLIELGAGFHSEATGAENIYLNASLLGLSRPEIKRRFDEIVSFAALEAHIDAPLRTYSSGMAVRLGFSIAAHVDAEVLLLDEVLAVGDESFQRRCYDFIRQFRKAGGTIVFVSHAMDSVRNVCEQAAWIEGGQLRDLGPASQVVQRYLDRVRSEWKVVAQDGIVVPREPDVEIECVRLLDSAGESVDTIATGQELVVEIHYRVHRRVEEPAFGVAIVRNDGLYVFGTNTAADGVVVPGLATAGEGCLALHYPALALMNGVYRVSVGLFSQPGMLPVDFHDQRYEFRVESEQEMHGAVQLAHEWSLTRGAAG
jgi:ABC-type polysaccharide/polyol phosphate transport system ATPase subunit